MVITSSPSLFVVTSTVAPTMTSALYFLAALRNAVLLNPGTFWVSSGVSTKGTTSEYGSIRLFPIISRSAISGVMMTPCSGSIFLAEDSWYVIFSLSGQMPGCYLDRKSTRLNSSHQIISYAVFCLKKKKNLLHPTDYRSAHPTPKQQTTSLSST